VTLQRELNRLAGTSGIEAQRVANILAGTTGKELLFALNVIAGTAGRELNGTLKLIATQNGGDGNLDGVGAMNTLAVGSIVVGGFDAYPISFSMAYTDGPAFYDGAGASY
jgi:hypothetical protein